MIDFEQASLEAATSFLQTVVLMDDMAAFIPADDGITDLGATVDEAPLDDPDDPSSPPAAPPTATSGAPATPEALAKTEAAPLDAGLVTRGFAALGLVCAVLRPYASNDMEKETLAAAERADIIVLDWEMRDKGEKATEILKHLLVQDEKAGGRLRLVTIYTGHSPLSNVYGSLKGSFEDFKDPKGLTEADLTLERNDGTARIVMFAKSRSPNATQDAPFVVNEAELPKRLIDAFSKFAGGLLPNTTLASIAALRRSTHRMLARMDKSLDGPLITHRILVGDAGDSDEFVAGAIMEELESQVPLAQIVRRYTGPDSIEGYFAYWTNKGLKPQMPLVHDIKTKQDLSAKEIKILVEDGLQGMKAKTDALKSQMSPEDAGELDNVLRKSLHKRLYFLMGDDKASRRAHEQFALITGMKRDMTTVSEADAETHPVMKLGTVLQSSKDQFWVCITPVCDCVRVPNPGAPFLLARLKKSSDEWSVIVRAGDQNVKLTVEKKRQTVRSVTFGPATGGLVRASFEQAKTVFREVGEDPGAANIGVYEWLGEMKPMQAQRIVQGFASNIARIGLDEFEWQRRHAPQG